MTEKASVILGMLRLVVLLQITLLMRNKWAAEACEKDHVLFLHATSHEKHIHFSGARYAFCEWQIASGNNSHGVFLKAGSVRLNSTTDSIQVYDGVSSNDTLLAKFSDKPHTEIHSRGHLMYIRLVSTDITANTTFTLVYRSAQHHANHTQHMHQKSHNPTSASKINGLSVISAVFGFVGLLVSVVAIFLVFRFKRVRKNVRYVTLTDEARSCGDDTVQATSQN